MTAADVLNAAASAVEERGDELASLAGDFSASAAIDHVAPDQLAALEAIKAYSRFLRRDGVGSQRHIGMEPKQLAAALRQAAHEAS